MKYSGQDLVLGGLFLSLALVVPFLFHAIGLGSAFLPMFFSGHYRWLSGGTPRGYGCWLHLTIDFYEKFSKEGG